MPGRSPCPPPRLVVALGVYRSASTWAANVVAELLRREGRASLVVADSAAALAEQISGGTFVVKAHRPDASLKLLIHAARLPVVVTVREPADCVASLMERFKEGFDAAAGAVSVSCHEILQTLPLSNPIVLRYEAADARGSATILRLASYLDVAMTSEEAEALAARYAPHEVRRTIDRLTERGTFGDDPRPHHVDRETQWHPGPLGSGLPGRGYNVLTPTQIARVEASTQAFRETFAYALPAPRPDVDRS